MTYDDKPARPGDWIRFYRDGKLVIGVVEYLTYIPYIGRQYYTEIGEVSHDHVMEIRRKEVF